MFKPLLTSDHLSSLPLYWLQGTNEPTHPPPTPDLYCCIPHCCSNNSSAAKAQAARPSQVVCQESRLHLCAHPIPVQRKLLSRRAWGAVCTYGSEQAGQLAAGKGRCWGICSFDVLPRFVGPRQWGTTSVVQKPSTSVMCRGTHSPTAAGSHRLQGRMGSDGPLQGSTHFSPTQVPAPGPWWQETLSHLPCPQHSPSDFLEILQTDRQQWEPCLLPTATWLVPQRWQTEARCWHLFRGGKGIFWTIWCSHLGKKWVLLKSWENSCWAHLCPLGSSLSVVPSQGWWGWA